MKSHRKLLSKTMLIYAINFVLGIAVGWLMKPSPKKREHKADYRNARGAIPWDELIWGNPSLADTQPIKITK